MNETLAYGYSSESAQHGLSNEYEHDRVSKNLRVLVLRTKVAPALEGLSGYKILNVNIHLEFEPCLTLPFRGWPEPFVNLLSHLITKKAL